MRSVTLVVAALIGTIAMDVHAQAHRVSLLVFPEMPQNFAVDTDAQRVFVPMHGGHRVAEIALPGELQEVASHALGNEPVRVNLSADRSELWVALAGAGRVARMTRASAAVQDFDVSAALGSVATWDVMPGLAGEVYVSANPFSGEAFIARLDPATGQATRVADGQVISRMPIFEIDRRAGWLYLGEVGSPFVLRKLDATQNVVPIVLSTTVQFGSIGLSLKPDGSQIAINGSSPVLWTSDFGSASATLFGTPIYRADAAELGVFSTGTITVRETTNYTITRSVDAFGCGFSQSPQQVSALPRGDGWLMLSGNRLCKVESSDYLHASGF